MRHKKWVAMALLATAAVTGTAFADNRGVNTALGAVVGAVIGNSVGGQNAAVVGGVLGAVVGASVSGSGHYNDGNYGRHQPQGYYQAPVHYRSAPVYVQPNYRGSYSNRDAYRYQRHQHNTHRVDYERRNYRR